LANTSYAPKNNLNSIFFELRLFFLQKAGKIIFFSNKYLDKYLEEILENREVIILTDIDKDEDNGTV